MFVQTENTPNPNSLKFFPGKKVSNDDPLEITDKNESKNELIRNILSINGVTGIFLAEEWAVGIFLLMLIWYIGRGALVFFNNADLGYRRSAGIF